MSGPVGAMRSTIIALGGNATSQALRLLSNLLLTRLLYPEAFGLMALVLLALQALVMISDVGTLHSIIQHKRGEERAFLDTAWTVAALRGFILFALATLLAWPLSVLYEQPELMKLVPVLALTTIFSGLESTNVALAARHMMNGRLVLLDLGTQVCALVVNIAVAVETRSVWALVAGICISGALRTIASHVLLPGARNRPRLEKETVEALISFGKWVLLSTFITFLASRLDVLVLGKLLPMDQLGVYSLALMLSSIPTTAGGVVAGSVFAPVFARAFRDNFASLQTTFARARGILLPACAFVLLCTTLGASPFFALLYDDRYQDAAWITPLVIVQVWFNVLQDASTRVFVAMGESRPLVTANAAKLVVSAASAIGGYLLWGLTGFILGNAIGALVGLVILGVGLERRGLPNLKQDALWTAVVAFVGVAGLLMPAPLAEATGLRGPIASIVVAVIVLSAFAGIVGPRAVRNFRQR